MTGADGWPRLASARFAIVVGQVIEQLGVAGRGGIPPADLLSVDLFDLGDRVWRAPLKYETPKRQVRLPLSFQM